MIPVRIALVGRIALVTPDALARAAHRFHDPGHAQHQTTRLVAAMTRADVAPRD